MSPINTANTTNRSAHTNFNTLRAVRNIRKLGEDNISGIAFDKILKKYGVENKRYFDEIPRSFSVWGGYVVVINKDFMFELLKKVASHSLEDLHTFYMVSRDVISQKNVNESYQKIYEQFLTAFWLSHENAPDNLNYGRQYSEEIISRALEYGGAKAYDKIKSHYHTSDENILQSILYSFGPEGKMGEVLELLAGSSNTSSDTLSNTLCNASSMSSNMSSNMPSGVPSTPGRPPLSCLDPLKINPQRLCHVLQKLDLSQVFLDVSHFHLEGMKLSASSVAIKDFYNFINTCFWLREKYSHLTSDIRDYAGILYQSPEEIINGGSDFVRHNVDNYLHNYLAKCEKVNACENNFLNNAQLALNLIKKDRHAKRKI